MSQIIVFTYFASLVGYQILSLLYFCFARREVFGEEQSDVSWDVTDVARCTKRFPARLW